MLKPAERLVAVQRTGLAELQLTPGMPSSAHLPTALMQQNARCMGERMALLAFTLPAVANLIYVIRAEWRLVWLGLAIATVLQEIWQ